MISTLARTAVAVLAITLPNLVTTPAIAAATNHQTFDGFILVSGTTGTRTVVASGILARGAFTGVGTIVELPNLPTDPDNASRDDLRFRGGSMHLVSFLQDAQFSLNPLTCRFTARVTQTSQVRGGTGRFSSAVGDFTATGTARGRGARADDGSCSQTSAPLSELDTLAMTGTLSY
jgi:hypothetical protein